MTSPIPPPPDDNDGPALDPANQKVLEALRERGLFTQVRILPASTRTAAQAAKALDCEVGAIANSLLLIADDSPLLVLTSGAHRIDLDLLAKSLGFESLRMATPDEVESATGQRVGGVSPVGHPVPIRTCLDAALAHHPVIWTAAGTSNSVLSTSFEELRTATDADVVEVN